MKKQEQKQVTAGQSVRKVPYSRLSAINKRKALAQDVLDQIKAKKFEIRAATYCDIQNLDSPGKLQLNKAIKDSRVVCTVCAKGSLLLAKVDKQNHLNVSEFRRNFQARPNSTRSANIIKKVTEFSEKQLQLIEGCFEGYDVWGTIEDFDYVDLRAFFNKYDSDINRLRVIMRMIIKHPKGLFEPFKKIKR